MKIDNWIERGINSLSSGEFFDGIQLLEGAIQRIFRFNQPSTALKVFKRINEVLIAEGLGELYCQFLLNTIPLFKRKVDSIDWFLIFPDMLLIIRESEIPLCISKLLNRMILETKLVEENLIQSLLEYSTRKQYSKEIMADLHYYYAGLLVIKKEYVKCFEILKEMTKLVPNSPNLLAYLTLAELNAYEIEDCGKYIDEAKSLPETSSYIELASHIYKSVESGNYDLYSSIIGEYSEIVNAQNDALLKGLCDGISDFLKPKGKRGLFSLFGG